MIKFFVTTPHHLRIASCTSITQNQFDLISSINPSFSKHLYDTIIITSTIISTTDSDPGLLFLHIHPILRLAIPVEQSYVHVTSLKELVLYSRSYYEDKFKKREPFICISHDGWDSVDHDILGVCVHFVVPGYWRMINVAVGLKRIRSKKSKSVAKAIHIILER